MSHTPYTSKPIRSPGNSGTEVHKLDTTSPVLSLIFTKYLTKNNFIFFSEVLEHVFHVVNQMRPAFIRIELYPFVFDKAPQYFYTIQFWRIFWKIKDV